VRDRRIALGLTCARLAEKSGISDTTLWRIETGRVRPNRATIAVLAAALKCRPADLDAREGGINLGRGDP
jgi:transcriptional regulator with XRE-family HTH domain